MRALTFEIARMVPFAILRLTSLRDVRASENPLFARVPTVAWTQTALAYSMATATIPCLMAFMIKLNTGFGAMNPETVIEQTHQDSRSRSGAHIELRSVQPSQKSQNGPDVRDSTPRDSRDGADLQGTQGRMDAVNYQWAINSRKAEERSIASDDSRNMIIRKTVEFSSETEVDRN